MKRIQLLLLISIFITAITHQTKSQVAINIDESMPDSSAVLDLKSNNKGLLVPRMSQSEIGYIDNAANGLMVFNTTDDKFYTYISASNTWKEISYGIGELTPWVCGDTIFYEGQGYPTKLFGDQCWMTTNMNVGTLLDGEFDQTDNALIEKYCFGGFTSSCTTYGALYQWNEAMQYSTTEGAQGICPEQWHIATDDDFKMVEIHTGLTQAEADAWNYRGTNEGSILSAPDTTSAGALLWINGNLVNDPQFGDNEYNILPGGVRNSSTALGTPRFASLRFEAHLWTSTYASAGSNITYRRVKYNRTDIYRAETTDQNKGYSVRCIKD